MKINIDKEGKIAIPAEILMNLGINPGDSFSVASTGNGILLTPVTEKKQVDIESVIVLSGKQEGDTRYFTLK